MPPDPPDHHDDDQYASSEDSEFAPDDAPGHASEASEPDEPQTAEPSGKRRRPEEEAEEGYDNSGDEAIITKGRKRQKRARDKGEPSDDEGGEGGLVKTRRQRAQEKEERRIAASKEPVTVDVEALWEQMTSGKAMPTSSGDTKPDETHLPRDNPVEPLGDASDTIRIKRTYNFAGRLHMEEKVVARDSAEAKLHLATQDKENIPGAAPAKRAPKKAFRSAFEPVFDASPGRTDLDLSVAGRIRATKEAQAKKLNTVEKSRMDWAGYVDKEGIRDELALASKSKGSYNARQDFLARSEAIREDGAKKARLARRP